MGILWAHMGTIGCIVLECTDSASHMYMCIYIHVASEANLLTVVVVEVSIVVRTKPLLLPFL